MDELYQLEKDLHEAKNNLGKLGGQMKTSARHEAKLRSDYEELKNVCLIQLYDDEATKGTKRTEAQRTAIYRSTYKDERRAWLMAKADMDSDRDLFKGLMSKVNALQTLISVEKAKMNL